MNYIKHLSFFFQKVQGDQDMSPSQISIYLALFNTWNRHQFSNPIIVIRDEIMRLSKIMSKSTYHRSMKILHNNGYIIYVPSYNPFLGSKVYLIDFTNSAQFSRESSIKNKQAKNTDEKQTKVKNNTAIKTDNNTAIEKGIEPFIKHINNKHINHKQSLCTQAQIPSLIFNKKEEDNVTINQPADKNEMNQKEKSSAKKEKGKIPTFEEVIDFFQQKYQNTVEAEKFYYYFESNGWLVGGKTEMKNWKAAANNWMINADRYIKSNPPTFGVQKPLDTSPNKRYDEPL